jgi:predicted SnoaL-like aldol condensation-catalyzing enzyme
MPKTTPEQNKAIVLKAFDILFNKRDYNAAERFWSPTYIQHSAHIAPDREGLFKSSSFCAKHVALRKPTHCRRGRLRHRARPFLWKREARSLGRR